MISKHFAFVEIEVDEENGTIDLISPDTAKCILCISNIKFKKVNDKFTVIKVNAETSEALVLNDGVDKSLDEDLQTELSNLFKVIHYNLKYNDKVIDGESFLKLLTSEIKKFVTEKY